MIKKFQKARLQGLQSSIKFSFFTNVLSHRQKFIFALVASMFMASASGIFPVAAHAATPTATGSLALGNSSWCLDDYAGGASDGNKIQLWGCHTGISSSQTWDFYGDGTIHLHSNPGYCVDNQNGTVRAGNPVMLWHCDGSSAQIWQPQTGGNGMTLFMNPQTQMCLDDIGNTRTAGNPIEIYRCLSTDAAEQWVMPQGQVVTPPPPPPSSFVTVCGTNLCLNGTPFTIHGATAYGTYSSPGSEVALAQAGKINTLELVEFDTQYHNLSDTMSNATWIRVDNFIATAENSGMHVILNLSEFGQSLIANKQTPTTALSQWKAYIDFIANRQNTVTHKYYKADPGIAMVELFGEIDAPNYGIDPGYEGTTQQMTTFFSTVENEWHAQAPNILVSSGGFSYLDNPNSGIDWQSIMKDPADSVCDIEVNSPSDLSNTVNKVTNYCKAQNKPWFLAAWSACYQDNGYPYYLGSDSAMSQHAQAMYDITHGNSPAAYPAIGSDFWNLQNGSVKAGSCDINPSYPLTWHTVQNN